MNATEKSTATNILLPTTAYVHCTLLLHYTYKLTTSVSVNNVTNPRLWRLGRQ